MATLVLSTVGTALGGPFGGLIGTMVGQAIDQSLFGPGPRKGPRLGDLSIQTSSYGTPIPRVYGTMRVAGTVVWATELIESEQMQGGYKGQPDVIAYSYAASFAVALSSRSATRIARIWADGRQIRTSEGAFTVDTTFRFHPGLGDQPVDPLIGSIEGADATPAYRGLALAVFENFQLGEFGNRIPVLTFELVADEGGIGLGPMLSDITEGTLDSPSAIAIGGYAAHGRDRRDAIEPLVELNGLAFRDEGDGRLVDAGNGAPSFVPAIALGCSADGERADRFQIERQPVGTLPARLALTYYEPSRDYQAGRTQAESGSREGRDKEIDCPITSTAEEMRGLTENALARAWQARDRLTIMLPPTFAGLRNGDVLTVEPLAGAWTVVSSTIERWVITVEARRTAPAVAFAAPSDAGRAVLGDDRPLSPTRLFLVEPPALGEEAEPRPRLLLAAATAGPWKPVPVELSANNVPLPGVVMTRPSRAGTMEGGLESGPATIIDARNDVIVRLVEPGALLLSCDDQALGMGANIAMAGNEMLQFGRAEPLGAGRYRLSRLVRGLFGTEWAIGSHVVGEPFLLLGQGERPIDLDPAMRGATISATPMGLADRGAPAIAMHIAGGEAMRAMAPAHVAARRTGDGGAAVTWVPRDRAWRAWADGEAPPIPALRFTIEMTGTLTSRRWESEEPQLSIDPAAMAALGPGVIHGAIRTIGRGLESRPKMFEL